MVVKLLACRARDPGFDSRSRRYDFRDWLSPAPSRDIAERLLKRHKSSKQPTIFSWCQKGEMITSVLYCARTYGELLLCPSYPHACPLVQTSVSQMPAKAKHDRQMDIRQSDSHQALCFAGATKMDT